MKRKIAKKGIGKTRPSQIKKNQGKKTAEAPVVFLPVTEK